MVYLCVKLPRLLQGAVTERESRVAAAEGDAESTGVVKPGGFQPVGVASNATTLHLKGGTQNNNINRQFWLCENNEAGFCFFL